MDNKNFDFSELLILLRKNFQKLLMGMILGSIVALFILLFMITPKYSSQTQLIAQIPQQDQMMGNNVNNNLMMINTYKDLIKSNIVIDDATKELNEKYHYQLTTKEVNDSISVSQQQNSQMFTVTSTSANPKEARDIANVVAKIFKQKALKVMKVNKISITSKAVANPKPVSPNKLLGILLGALIGLFGAVAWVLISSSKDKTVKSEEWLTDTLGVTILGNIPKMSDKDFSRVSAK